MMKTTKFSGLHRIASDSFIELDKIVAILGFVGLILGLLIISSTPPASGYEINIYGKYPLYFWLIIVFSTVCGLFIIIKNAFSPETRPVSVITGILLVILTNLAVIWLPVFRNYYISDIADEITHLAMIKDIVLNGHFGGNDFYPISHILSYIMSSVLGWDARLTIKLVPALFYLVYIVGMFLLARQMLKKTGALFLAMAFALPLLFNYFNYLFLPTQFCLYIVPILLFLYFNHSINHKLAYYLLFLVMIIFATLLHSLGTLFIVGIFLLLAIAIYLQHKTKSPSELPDEFSSSGVKHAIMTALITFILVFTWFSNFAIFNKSVTRAFDSLIYGSGESAISNMADKLAETIPLSSGQLIELFFQNYTHILLFAILAAITITTIFWRLLRRHSAVSLVELFLSISFIGFTLFYAATLFGSFLGTGRSIRIFCWALVFGILLNGLFYYDWINKIRRFAKTLMVFLLVCVFVVSVYFGVLNVYHSPWIYEGNLQLSYAHWSGLEWYYSNKDMYPTTYLCQSVYRAPGLIYGYSSEYPPQTGSRIPTMPNLGYDNTRTLARSFVRNYYLVISRYDLEIKNTIWPHDGLYTVDDLNQLYVDPAVNLVFQNGDTEIWEVIITK